jgi:hypothetical protein
MLDFISFPLPIHRYFRIEDELQKFGELTQFDMNVVKNVSASKSAKHSLTKREKEILNTLYASDFHLGNYEKQV